MKVNLRKDFFVELRVREDESGLIQGKAIFQKDGDERQQKHSIPFRFRRHRLLTVGVMVRSFQGEQEQLLFQMLEDPLITDMNFEKHFKSSNNLVMALAVSGPLRASLGALMIIEEPKAGLGDLSDDVEYYLRRVDEARTVPSKKYMRWSTFLTFGVPSKERDILFAALTRMTWQEGFLRSIKQHRQEGL